MDYICEYCGDWFNENDLTTIKDGIDYELWGQKGTYEFTEQVCPHCGGYVVEADDCPICGELMPLGQDLCDHCLSEYATLDIALEYGAKETTDLSINSFLAYKFSTEEIEEILIATLKASETEKDIKQSIKEYFDEDRESVARFLEQRED